MTFVVVYTLLLLAVLGSTSVVAMQLGVERYWIGLAGAVVLAAGLVAVLRMKSRRGDLLGARRASRRAAAGG